MDQAEDAFLLRKFERAKELSLTELNAVVGFRRRSAFSVTAFGPQAATPASAGSSCIVEKGMNVCLDNASGSERYATPS